MPSDHLLVVDEALLGVSFGAVAAQLLGLLKPPATYVAYHWHLLDLLLRVGEHLTWLDLMLLGTAPV